MTSHVDATGPSRRRVLGAGGAGLALTGTLAACGGEEDTPEVVPEDGDSAEGGTGAAVSVPVSEVPEGGSVFRSDTHLVLTQPTAGEFHAFDATCPHEGCAVSRSDGAELVCPCHSSRFALATGDVVGGPAPRGLTELTVRVEGDVVVVER